MTSLQSISCQKWLFLFWKSHLWLHSSSCLPKYLRRNFFELFNVIILWQLLPIKLSIKISQLPSSNNFATKPQRTSQQITATINICLHWYFDYMQVVSKIKGGKYPRAQTNIILLLEMFRCLLRKPGKLFVYNWNWIKRDGEFNASLKPHIRCRQKSIFYPEMLSHIIVAVDVQGVSF